MTSTRVPSSSSPRAPSGPGAASPPPAARAPSTSSPSAPSPRRRGLFDAALCAILVYAVYAKTPIGALGETGVRAALGQRDRPSLFATFKGRETAVDVAAPRIADAVVQVGARHAAIVAAARQHGVDEAALAALFSVHGACGAGGCSMPTPPRLFEALGEITGRSSSTPDEIARALAATTGTMDGDVELGVEALYVGASALRRAIDAARAGGALDPDEPDLHAEYLSPGLRRGPLQAALSVIAVHRLDTLAWPADASFRISSPFGDRIHPVTGKKAFHNGTDVATPTGTPLVAAHDGRVKRASRDSISGTYLVLDHGMGIETTYCHLSAVDAEEQARVIRKAKVASSGATGRVTGPHLHYILKVGGTAVDAEQYGEAPSRR